MDAENAKTCVKTFGVHAQMLQKYRVRRRDVQCRPVLQLRLQQPVHQAADGRRARLQRHRRQLRQTLCRGHDEVVFGGEGLQPAQGEHHQLLQLCHLQRHAALAHMRSEDVEGQFAHFVDT